MIYTITYVVLAICAESWATSGSHAVVPPARNPGGNTSVLQPSTGSPGSCVCRHSGQQLLGSDWFQTTFLLLLEESEGGGRGGSGRDKVLKTSSSALR